MVMHDGKVQFNIVSSDHNSLKQRDALIKEIAKAFRGSARGKNCHNEPVKGNGKLVNGDLPPPRQPWTTLSICSIVTRIQLNLQENPGEPHVVAKMDINVVVLEPARLEFKSGDYLGLIAELVQL
ncbi:uncharacterized protein BP5553_10270 [Venustampulla echinocandica]|uniref:Uncharacterized protein n=1 Tax=Venustampulla echinocandica TaxID=2656787 RepID=A0A370T9T6_9HELO|nr:uncharacterized protein BP5553_10270 [Venustampulla echinocandica]RDL30392.1 hypothetical protein BP5553_10270 [Venustampulla echinocandica]